MFRKCLVLVIVVPLFSYLVLSQEAAPKPKTTVSPSVQVGPSTTATAPDLLIKNFDFPELARKVAAMPASADRDYFAGVLANRKGQVSESSALLEKVLPQLEASNPARAAVALHTLADDYTKAYRYADAVGAFEKLLHGFASHMDADEKKSAEDDYKVAVLLKDAPPQTISFEGPVNVPTTRNPVLGSIDVKLTANNVEQAWILDTGANFSAVSASFAQKLGVTLSKETAETQGLTGAENPLHVGILPELKIGGAVLHNVVLLVLEDSSLNVPTGPHTTDRYQLQAALGNPVMQALGRVTFTHDGRFLAGPDSPSSENGARLYMNQLTPLLDCGVENREVLFSFDTGANGSVFSDRYYRDFPDQFRGAKKKLHIMGGAGGVKKMHTYFLPQVKLQVGNVQAVLHDVPVAPIMHTDMDKLYGNLGRDLIEPYPSFTVDFANMRFLIAQKPAKP